jgi:hypothetical protein
MSARAASACSIRVLDPSFCFSQSNAAGPLYCGFAAVIENGLAFTKLVVMMSLSARDNTLHAGSQGASAFAELEFRFTVSEI